MDKIRRSKCLLNPAIFGRIVALFCGVLLVVLIECALRFAFSMKWLQGNSPDSYIEFIATEPLFALNPFNNRYEIRLEREPYFIRNGNGFSRFKTKDTFRIFVLGGSTVQGRPYSIETAFPEWLKINLQLRYPELQFEVVNCGGVSYASYRLLPIFEECLHYEPDLIILCTGHNEFLEARSSSSIKKIVEIAERPILWIRKLALYRCFNHWYARMVEAKGKHEQKVVSDGNEVRSVMKMEVDALLDYRNGLEAYRRDQDWKQAIEIQFENNMLRMLSLGERAGVPMIVLNPPYNLKDCPPFKSQHRDGLSESERIQWTHHLNNARQFVSSDPQTSFKHLKASVRIDPEFAWTSYSLGHAYHARGDSFGAELYFQKALEEDICPLRELGAMREFVENLCLREEIPFLDLQAVLLSHSAESILGGEFLLDHVHPSIKGHQIIGEALVDMVEPLFSISKKGKLISETLQPELKRYYQSHLNSLPVLYYTHGEIRLKNLNAWTQGRADGPLIESHQVLE